MPWSLDVGSGCLSSSSSSSGLGLSVSVRNLGYHPLAPPAPLRRRRLCRIPICRFVIVVVSGLGSSSSVSADSGFKADKNQSWAFTVRPIRAVKKITNDRECDNASNAEANRPGPGGATTHLRLGQSLRSCGAEASRTSPREVKSDGHASSRSLAPIEGISKRKGSNLDASVEARS
jgi:hypothetical protein